MTHYRYNVPDVHLEFLSRARFNLGKMFTPPKSKDPWTAMTKGSTGGWAKPFAKPATLLPAAAALAAAPFTGGSSMLLLPTIGATVGGIQGLTTGLWGKPGAGSALGGAGWGGLQGLGIGMGAGGGFQQAANWLQGLGGAGAGGVGAGAGAGGGTNWLSNQYNLGSFAPGATGGGGGVTAPAWWGGGTASATATAPATGGGWWNQLTKGINLPQAALGMGISAAGEMFGKPTGQLPKSPVYESLTERLGRGSPLKSLATTQSIDIMNRPEPQFTPLSEEMYETAVRRNVKEEEKAVEQAKVAWKGARPGVSFEGDSDYRKYVTDMKAQFSSERQALNNELAFNRETEYTRRLDDYYKTKMDYLTNVMQLDIADVQTMAQIAEMDLGQIAFNFGLDMGKAQNIKKMFGDLGTIFTQKGMGMDYASFLQSMSKQSPISAGQYPARTI